MKKVDFLVVNNDWGLGTAADFSKMLKSKDQYRSGRGHGCFGAGHQRPARKAQIHRADTLIVTGAVEQLTLSSSRRLRSASSGASSPLAGRKIRISFQQAGTAAEGTMHLVFFAPWAPDATPSPAAAKALIKNGRNRAIPFAGLPKASAVTTASGPLPQRSNWQELPSPKQFARRCGRSKSTGSMARLPLTRSVPRAGERTERATSLSRSGRRFEGRAAEALTDTSALEGDLVDGRNHHPAALRGRTTGFEHSPIRLHRLLCAARARDDKNAEPLHTRPPTELRSLSIGSRPCIYWSPYRRYDWRIK